MPGLCALLTCSDKPVASFGAKRDFSLRSTAHLDFTLLCRTDMVCSPRPLGMVCQPFFSGLWWEQFSVFYYKTGAYNGTLGSIRGWGGPSFCPRSHPILPVMLGLGLSSPKVVTSHSMSLKILLVCAAQQGHPLQTVAAGVLAVKTIPVRGYRGYIYSVWFLD